MLAEGEKNFNSATFRRLFNYTKKTNMEKLLSIVFSTLLCLTAFGQVDIKEVDQTLKKVNEELYASKYEVSNKLYMIFLNSLEHSNKADLLHVAQIDSLNWEDASSYNEPYVHYYHSQPTYLYYPVVNISYEGAKLFCAWLTKQYNSNPKRKFDKVLFRLPTEKEWISAARAGDSTAIYAWEGKSLRNRKGGFKANFKRELRDTVNVVAKIPSNGDITAPVNSYWGNSFGFYNMSGNVAEMLKEKGIAKGGSWTDGPESLKIEANYNYDGNAQTHVGFRYFAEILENK